MATTQKFLDNVTGLPVLWNIIKTNFAHVAFKTITDGTHSIEAAAIDDTLTLAAGENVAIEIDSAHSSITFSATDTTYDAATTSAAGLMSAADKEKLEGIATGAEVNQNAFASITDGTSTVAAASKTDAVTFTAGSNVQIALDGTDKEITFSATDTTYSDVVADETGAAASGLMTSEDKYKLDNIEAGGEVNVLEGVQVNGTDLTIDANKKVNVTVASGTTGVGTLKVNGTDIAVYGLGTAAAATVETTGVSSNTTTLPTTAQVKTYADGLIVQTVTDGDTTHAPSGDAVADAIASAISTVYKYKGSVASQSDLPASNQQVGDVYNIQAASDYGDAGMNVAWTGSAWDALGGSIIMTAMTQAEIEAICTFADESE